MDNKQVMLMYGRSAWRARMSRNCEVELGRVVFAPGKVRVESLETEESQAAQRGQKVQTYTGTTKVIMVRLGGRTQSARKGDNEIRDRRNRRLSPLANNARLM
ncbi:hypothetical protein FXF51_41150 [Nonomuraea sp. PA05]|uniref:hypothetical protein n=1 Tax=Nonomuraea sp. PA05 TaxID=2604466 RepID=UPI0011D6A6FB|nr:hypothetical protein [Nonomuraea sp. PA05]TYB57232.1 hypothetical protein FXF51_41150 [Nonomuraea sp. PA05]